MPEGTPRQDHGPFDGQLQENIFNDPDRNRATRLQRLEGHDDLVIRVDKRLGATTTELETSRYNYQNDPTNEDVKNDHFELLDKHYEINKASAYRDYLTKLESFGIKNSGYMPVIGKAPVGHEAQRYIPTNKIEGVSGAHDLSSIPEHALIKTVRNLLDYYKDVYKQGGIINWELALDQFVYDPSLDEMILVDHQPKDLDKEIAAGDTFWRDQFEMRLLSDLSNIEAIYHQEYPELEAEIHAAFAVKRS